MLFLNTFNSNVLRGHVPENDDTDKIGQTAPQIFTEWTALAVRVFFLSMIFGDLSYVANRKCVFQIIRPIFINDH